MQHQLASSLALEAAYPAFAACICPRAASSSMRFRSSISPDGRGSEYTGGQSALWADSERSLLTAESAAGILLLMPFPQYTSLPDPGGYRGNSTLPFTSGQGGKALLRGRIAIGGVHVFEGISDVETLTTWLDSAMVSRGFRTGMTSVRERPFPVSIRASRLTVSYVVDLPLARQAAALRRPRHRRPAGVGLGLTALAPSRWASRWGSRRPEPAQRIQLWSAAQRGWLRRGQIGSGAGTAESTVQCRLLYRCLPPIHWATKGETTRE